MSNYLLLVSADLAVGIYGVIWSVYASWTLLRSKQEAGHWSTHALSVLTDIAFFVLVLVHNESSMLKVAECMWLVAAGHSVFEAWGQFVATFKTGLYLLINVHAKKHPNYELMVAGTKFMLMYVLIIGFQVYAVVRMLL